MHFKKLEIFGFKSFAEKTILHFEPGITAVVGPNGCGKSNVFDSIRWVLGEQSVKELRGSSMEDVIFNGTDKQPGLGFAEVSLTFANESKLLPIEYDEVTITRRLFRSGESEYLLNKTQVRLKDITELLMGTGIGAEAYSLVQQGKVDLVVSARPEERRVIFDEASGITKYKSKKKEALNKLKDTENNLLRINDIVLEVKRQIGSIERQANKARKFKEEFERLKSLEIAMARIQFNSFYAQQLLIESTLEQFSSQEKKLEEEILEAQNVVEYESATVSDLDDRIDQINAEELKLSNDIELNHRQTAFNEERLENLNLNEARFKEQKTQALERQQIQRNKIEECFLVLKSIDTQLESSLKENDLKKEELNSLVAAIDAHKENIKQEDQKIKDLNALQSKRQIEMTEVLKEHQSVLSRQRHLEAENQKVAGEKLAVDQRLTSVDQEILNISVLIHSLKENVTSQENLISTIKDTLINLDFEIDEAEKKKVFLSSQKSFIEEMRVHYQDIPDPIVEGKLITNTLPLDKHSGIIGKVKEVIPLAGNEQGPMYDILCEIKFIEFDPALMALKIEELDQKIEYLLDLREAELTRLTEQKQILQQLILDLHAQEKKWSILDAQKGDISLNAHKLSNELQMVSQEMVTIQHLLAQLKAKEESVNQQIVLQSEQILVCQNNVRLKQEALNLQIQSKEDLTVLLAQIQSEISAMQDKRKSIVSNQHLYEESLQAAESELTKLEEDLLRQSTQRQKFLDEIVELSDKIEFIKQKKGSLKDVLSGYEKQKHEISSRLNGLRHQMQVMQKDIEEIKNSRHEKQMLAQQLHFSQNTIKERLQQVYKLSLEEISNLKEPQNSIQTISIGAATLTLENKNTDVATTQESVSVAHLSEEELFLEIEKLRKKCETYGTVNLVAIEEFEELRQRFEFLTKQQSDLITAKESLHQTISKINRTTKEMFLQTFEKVAEEFRTHFRLLFGGGDAQLTLLDPDNVLESGIEIIARPPGKKLQNIGLLSGGEKTLTAIALIFGVFKVRPSPFCVLDEIDAALDESNVGRFGEMLKEFAKIAQFIVITHNKKTINKADVMYGVTMQQTGISKVVSVKFADLAPKEISQSSQENLVPEPVSAS